MSKNDKITTKEDLDKAISKIQREEVFKLLDSGIKPDGESLNKALAIEETDDPDRLTILASLLIYGAKPIVKDGLITATQYILGKVGEKLLQTSDATIKLSEEITSKYLREPDKYGKVVSASGTTFHDLEIKPLLSTIVYDKEGKGSYNITLPDMAYALCCKKVLESRKDGKQQNNLASSPPQRITLKVRSAPNLLSEDKDDKTGRF